MSIIVYPRNEQERLDLLTYLNDKKYNFTLAEHYRGILTPEHGVEIIARDKDYEDGKVKSYSLEEIITHFDL